MRIRNTRYQWGAITIALHWIVFLMAATMIATGKMSADGGGPPDKQLMAIHAPVGFLLLALMVCRYIWNLVNPGVRKIDDAVGFAQVVVAWLVHNLLYVAVIAQALIGIAMTQAGGRPAVFFGLEFPQLVGPGGLLSAQQMLAALQAAGLDEGDSARESLRHLHHLVGHGFIALVAVHFLAALYHLLVRRDDLLRRMWFGYVPPELRDGAKPKE